jgi:hypothetical protein
MQATINANGYKGIKGEIISETASGAYVKILRKGTDLAARIVFFVWGALKTTKEKVADVEPTNLLGGGPTNKKARAQWAKMTTAQRRKAARKAQELYDGTRTVARCWNEALAGM